MKNFSQKFFLQKFFSQKIFTMLFVGLFLGSCTVYFGTHDSTVDSTIWSNLNKEYYSIDMVTGVHDTATYSSLSFDTTDRNMVFITNVIDGTTISKEWYYIELLETRGNTNAAFQLYGNNSGRYNNMYMGVSISSNQDGSFIKWHVQDREAFVIDITLDIITNHNFASDEMIFRPFKKRLGETAYEIDSSGSVVLGGRTFTATNPNPGEYAFDDTGGSSVINHESTILYVLDDSSIEVMTKDSGDYVVIEYANDSTKMKMIRLVSSVTISKDSVVSKLNELTYYNYAFASEEDTKFIGNISGKQFTLCSGTGVDGLITFGEDTGYYNGSLYFTGDAPYRHLAFKSAESPTSASYLSYQEDNTTRTYKVSIDGDSLIVVDDEDNESKYIMSDSTATTRVAMSKNIFVAMWNASGSTLEHGDDITLYGDDGYQATAFVGVSGDDVLSATYTYDINKSKYDDNIKDTSNVVTSSSYTDIKDYVGAIVHQGLYVGAYEYIRISGTDYKFEISEDGLTLSLLKDDGSVYRTLPMSDVTVSKSVFVSLIDFSLTVKYTGSFTITVKCNISLGYGFAGNKISINNIDIINFG